MQEEKKRKRLFLAEVCLCRGNSSPSALAFFPRDHKLKKCVLWLLLMFSTISDPCLLDMPQLTGLGRVLFPRLVLSMDLSVGLCACGLYSCVYNTPWSVVLFSFYNSMRLLGPLQAMNRCSQTSLLLTGCLCPFPGSPDGFLLLSSCVCFLTFLGTPFPFSPSPPVVFLIYQNNF